MFFHLAINNVAKLSTILCDAFTFSIFILKPFQLGFYIIQLKKKNALNQPIINVERHEEVKKVERCGSLG